MRIREYTPADFYALRRLHSAQGFGYPFPDLDSPLFVVKLVLEEEPDESRASFSRTGFSLSHLNTEPNKRTPDRLKPVLPETAPSHSRELASDSRIKMAVLLRLTAEAYLLHDPQAGAPRERWENFLALHEAVLERAAAAGLDDAQAFLPPRVARAFGRRLERLGWRRDPWPCFSRVTRD